MSCCTRNRYCNCTCNNCRVACQPCQPGYPNPCVSVPCSTVKGAQSLLRALTAQVPPPTGEQHTLSLPAGQAGLAVTIVRATRTDTILLTETDLSFDISEVVTKIMTLLPAP